MSNFSEGYYIYQSSPVLGRTSCISRGNIPSCCHCIKTGCVCLAADPRQVAGFLFLGWWSRGNVSVSPGEGIPSLQARKSSHAQGLHILWSAFFLCFHSAKNGLEK